MDRAAREGEFLQAGDVKVAKALVGFEVELHDVYLFSLDEVEEKTVEILRWIIKAILRIIRKFRQSDRLRGEKVDGVSRSRQAAGILQKPVLHAPMADQRIGDEQKFSELSLFPGKLAPAQSQIALLKSDILSAATEINKGNFRLAKAQPEAEKIYLDLSAVEIDPE